MPASRLHGRIARGIRLGVPAALLSLLAGCAGVGVPPPKAGYDALVDPLESLASAPLAGRRITLDPGHGGWFRGAVGVHGLTEAEVNLGVALELARLLRERGAEVLLTRESDRDFLTPADSSLRSDLAERVRMSNEFHPDLFVSIHHNADARGAHNVNETQVYFQLGDEGPALEAAADIHRFLTRNLGIGASRLLSGNYAVLRVSEAPALLTESSYITYPPTEARLAREEARRIEAEALALGIAAYFSRKAPVIERFAVSTPTSTGDSVFATGYPTLSGQVSGPFDGATMTLDGVPIPALREEGSLSWWPVRALNAGPHEATLLVRLAAEGSSRRARVRFEVRPPAESLLIEFPDQPSWDGRQAIAARLSVLSREGVRVRDSLSLRVRPVGVLLAPADTTITLRDGVAWAYFRRAPRIVSTLAKVSASRIVLEASRVDSSGATRTPKARARLPIVRERVPDAVTYFAVRMPEGIPLRDAPGTREPDPAIRWINRDGFVRAGMALRIEAHEGSELTHSTGRPALPGFHTWEDASIWPRGFVAIAGGALHGRRIVVDPAGGGDDPGGVSPSGGRGAALNLEVARTLAAMLEAAGAEVRLTRGSDAPVSEMERVRIAEGFRAERYVRIGHPAERPRLGHYFSSAPGKRWGERLAGIAADFGLPRPTVGDDAQYPIQQTSATALYAGLGRVDDSTAVLGAASPARLRAEAYVLWLSLAREWASEAAWPADSLEVRDAADRPIAGAVVRLGDWLVLETDALGRARFLRTEPGPLGVEVEQPLGIPRRVLLESERGIILTGPH